MIITKPDVEPDGLYNQGQAAKALHIDRHTIARYAANGLIKFRVRKASKAMITTGAEIIKCWKSMYL